MAAVLSLSALALVCSSSLPQAGDAPLSAVASEAGIETPRLVVLLAVDQLIPEQLVRLEPHLHGGLGRLLREGAVFQNAALGYVRTETGAGHATLSTGCLPRSHGVVGNSFYDRTEERVRYCVEDLDAMAVTSSGIVETTGQRSPRTIQRPALGEHMQATWPGAKVVSVSSKDRAAVSMAGAAADALVLWWDKQGSGFTSSTYYCDELPEFVARWNQGWMSEANGWEWTSTIPPEPHTYGTEADERAGERPLGALGVTFPYAIAASDNPRVLAGLVYQTPLADRFTCDMGRAAVATLELGADDVPDLLALSFSGCDVVGHANGPYSHEVTDLLLRLDRELGALFAELDARVGPGRWIAGLSADHGVLPLPEHLVKQGHAARRVPGGEVGEFRRALRDRLIEELGHDVKAQRGNGGVTLDRKSLADSGVDPAEAQAALLASMRDLAITTDWIEAVYGIDEIAAFGDDATGAEGLLRDSYHPERMADVVVLQRPHLLIGYGNGTSHGTHHWYDRHVPVIVYGAGVAAARRGDRCGSHDIVPTLLGLLGVEPMSPVDGRNLLAR